VKRVGTAILAVPRLAIIFTVMASIFVATMVGGAVSELFDRRR